MTGGPHLTSYKTYHLYIVLFSGHDGFDSISDCLTNAEVVVVPAGVSQRQGERKLR